jgi:hypothetical protein
MDHETTSFVEAEALALSLKVVFGIVEYGVSPLSMA